MVHSMRPTYARELLWYVNMSLCLTLPAYRMFISAMDGCGEKPPLRAIPTCNSLVSQKVHLIARSYSSKPTFTVIPPCLSFDWSHPGYLMYWQPLCADRVIGGAKDSGAERPPLQVSDKRGISIVKLLRRVEYSQRNTHHRPNNGPTSCITEVPCTVLTQHYSLSWCDLYHQSVTVHPNLFHHHRACPPATKTHLALLKPET